ncbi:MAG TPA: hypothetical protein VFC67_13960 [Prolixibacteraceae bacterium]|nr:hypothetical protein [Prolixibacteraceae bacterium]
MKPEYPVFFAKTSTVIAIPIILITLSFYITRAINLPANEVFPLAIAAFGITAALSGICFTMAPTKTDESAIRYAGEKFLHSSLLLIQSVIVIYAKDSLLSLDLMTKHGTIKIIIVIVFSSVISLVSVMAAITWYHGFDSLNSDLWEKWKKRIEDMRKSNKKESEK